MASCSSNGDSDQGKSNGDRDNKDGRSREKTKASRELGVKKDRGSEEPEKRNCRPGKSPGRCNMAAVQCNAQKTSLALS